MIALEKNLSLCDLGWLMEDVSVPKVSTVHQGFAGTFTRMDGNDGEERKRDIYKDHKMRTFQSQVDSM